MMMMMTMINNNSYNCYTMCVYCVVVRSTLAANEDKYGVYNRKEYLFKFIFDSELLPEQARPHLCSRTERRRKIPSS